MKVNANPLNYTDEITINLSVKEALKLMLRIEDNWPKPYKHEGGKEMIELHNRLALSVQWRADQESK